MKMFRVSVLLLVFTIRSFCTAAAEQKRPNQGPPLPSEPSQEVYNEQPDPNVVKAHLKQLVTDYIDRNKDSYVTVDELRDWIKIVREKSIQDNVDRQWIYYDPQVRDILSWDDYKPEQQQFLSWEYYKNLTYTEEMLQEGQQNEDGIDMKEMVSRAERRWKTADQNDDGVLSKEEFKDYLHPEESTRLQEVLVLEAMEDMDADKNGEVSLEEYMEHLNKISGKEKEDKNWAPAQQNHFVNYLDKNKDGGLDKDEMKEWIVPSYDRNEAEAWRLISAVDTDRDTKITTDDIVNNHELFITLQPPEYWMQQNMPRPATHDEF